ncbi:Cof-type HAD-IIB family hydrolase [Carnobacterium maltaromaticum]|uniref:Cof-type HAD-IIB family hydrolase n=1 Tax=Carnobacterium maltaromaticum TaxID=2751 RepID=UPI000C76E378|nr:Cof-type HAD-IIB family hydrolase [Carnobacterium maltaromaticum]PLS38149.1 Cof-type HAD-IIB family hydrolase [Carnobacterium maltaromaticum]PLS38526.1 Cof-type HAD-IIB family hydrolase [Carnobacterium maltaromaticum]PLS38903.1 Cof-type HAD-IIB family hydrolase [Carnobacterium maltaromaticum]PLS45173.1 Cof-type HAD-IIB family hydrolase [Carnobacterium maltaromaticum]PLS48029.1 Cof-type HAD-IIB family hydrolase [Carnobacterium maltaromaticum]
MEKKLIAIDLDGTTLNNESKISLKTKDVFKKVRDAGHTVSIVTGRPYRISKQFYQELGLDSPIVNFNGALCHMPANKNWESQYHMTLERDVALDILSLKQHTDIHMICAEVKDSFYADTFYEPNQHFFPEGKNSFTALTPQNLKDNPTSVCLFTTAENQKPITNELIARYGDSIEVRTWGGNTPCLEVVSAGVQKALGVERIADVYGFKQKDIIAFGDEDNDYEMIQYAGHGVVMQNGIEALKNISNDITRHTNDEDGLALYLENYLNLA